MVAGTELGPGSEAALKKLLFCQQSVDGCALGSWQHELFPTLFQSSPWLDFRHWSSWGLDSQKKLAFQGPFQDFKGSWGWKMRTIFPPLPLEWQGFLVGFLSFFSGSSCVCSSYMKAKGAVFFIADSFFQGVMAELLVQLSTPCSTSFAAHLPLVSMIKQTVTDPGMIEGAFRFSVVFPPSCNPIETFPFLQVRTDNFWFVCLFLLLFLLNLIFCF